jgi:imidazolonepropionase
MDTRWDGLLLDARLITLDVDGVPYGAITDAALGWKEGRIIFAGPQRHLPGDPDTLCSAHESVDGQWISPGLIDCHTHVVFGGERAGEFEQRLEGVSYEDIARAGGGIASSVRATRAASEDELFAASLPRAMSLRADGVTTLEIKSGYGLELESELRMLRVARRIGTELGIGVRTTFLGAHALPPEYRGRADDYVEMLCSVMLPAIAQSGLADAVDAYCEGIGFSPAQTRRVFDAARAHELPVKLHADQLSDLDGAALLADYAGLSADHVEYTSESGARALAKSGSVAVLLPGAYLCLRETKLPPIDAFRTHGVAMAIATDCNPGTSPLLSLRLAMSLACTLFRLTPEEALRGATQHAARALGLGDRGRLRVGMRADFVRWQIGQPAELCYWLGGQLAHSVHVAGRRVA